MTTIKENFIPIEAIHPTELIKDELKARGMQKRELAERLGMKAPNLSRFFSTKANITPAMALKLEEALGIPADYWLALQLSYERDMAAIRKRDSQPKKNTGKSLPNFAPTSSNPASYHISSNS